MKLPGVQSALSDLKQEVVRNEKITTDLQNNLSKVRADASKHRQALNRVVANPSYACRIGPDGLQLLQNAAKPPR